MPFFPAQPGRVGLQFRLVFEGLDTLTSWVELDCVAVLLVQLHG
jgi:hypothetical protein